MLYNLPAHLESCIVQEKMKMFPHEVKKNPPSYPSDVKPDKDKVFCICRGTGWVRCIHSLWMWRCCLLPCTQLKDFIHADEIPMYTLCCYRFSCRSVQQCFWESIAKLVDGFWILTTLFAAFRNCRSVRSNFTAQAHLCFPLSDDPVNRETSQGKPGKYHTWVGRQKCDGQKSAKSVFTGFANELPKASRWRL